MNPDDKLKLRQIADKIYDIGKHDVIDRPIGNILKDLASDMHAILSKVKTSNG